ncbi:MAG: N-acetylmuramoyl-L-alanine amidase family protein [Candidatus Onthomonas sp.]
MQKQSPSRLAQAPRKERHLLSRLLTSVLALALAGLMLFFLWLAFSSLEHREAAQQSREADTASDLAAAEEAAEELALAEAQAQAFAMAADPEIPTVLDGVEGVTVDLIPLNEYSRPGVPLEGVSAIVIHYVGNPGTTAQQNRDYFASLAKTGEESVSSHFVIGTDGTIIQCIPLDEKSYCSNHRNADTISIECCHPDAEGAFTEETRAALVSLVRYLAHGYALSYDDVIRHYDVTGKICPKYYVEHEEAWTDLKDEIFQVSGS